MYIEDVTYIDFNGKERTETVMFHMFDTEKIALDIRYPDGLGLTMQRMVDNDDKSGLLDVLMDILKTSYGTRSADGMSFIKDEAKTNTFLNSIAFDKFLMSVYLDSETKGVAVFNAILGE